MNISKHFFIYSIKANLHVNFVRKRRHYFWLFQRIKVIFLIGFWTTKTFSINTMSHIWCSMPISIWNNELQRPWYAKINIVPLSAIHESWHISIAVCIIKRLPKIGDVFGASKEINKDICKTVKWRVVDGWNRTLALDAITFGVGVPF